MSPSPIPFVPGAVRELLRANEDMVALMRSADAITTRELPNPLVGPAMTIRAPGNNRPNIRVSEVRIMCSVWVPPAEVLVDLDPSIETDPEEYAWDVAALAGEILNSRSLMGRGPSFKFRNSSWRGEWINGPVTMVDTDRGDDHPIFRALIEVLMKVVTSQ